MIKIIGNILSLLLLSTLIFCCSKKYDDNYAKGHNPIENQVIEKNKQLEQSFAVANKVINSKEQENIRSFLERKKMDYKQYKGVYISTIKQGSNTNISPNNNVKLSYCFKSLNQEDSMFSKSKTIIINSKGDTQVPYGLIIGVQALTLNSQAYIIIPSTLNYFINDDGEKIKSEDILICKVSILAIN